MPHGRTHPYPTHPPLVTFLPKGAGAHGCAWSIRVGVIREQVAQVAQCTVETVRYYEKPGLLPESARTSGNFRVYGPEHVERLRFIRNCRALDMSQEDIHRLLDLADQPADGCGAINAVFDQHIAHVNERIRELMVTAMMTIRW